MVKTPVVLVARPFQLYRNTQPRAPDSTLTVVVLRLTTTTPLSCPPFAAQCRRALVPRTHRMVTWASSSKDCNLSVGTGSMVPWRSRWLSVVHRGL